MSAIVPVRSLLLVLACGLVQAAEEEAAAKAEADRIEAETLAKEAREAEEVRRLCAAGELSHV